MRIKSTVCVAFTCLCLGFTCLGQESQSKSKTILDSGLFVENLQLTIPWHTNIEDLHNYGNPRIDTLNRKRIKVVWDSVIIFNGVRMFLIYVNRFRLKGKYPGVYTLQGVFEMKDFDKALDYLKNNINVEPKQRNNRKGMMGYTWKTKYLRATLIKGRNVSLFDIAHRPTNS